MPNFQVSIMADVISWPFHAIKNIGIPGIAWHTLPAGFLQSSLLKLCGGRAPGPSPWHCSSRHSLRRCDANLPPVEWANMGQLDGSEMAGRPGEQKYAKIRNNHPNTVDCR